MPRMPFGEYKGCELDDRSTFEPFVASYRTQLMVNGVLAQREEILRAFIAKFGFEPERAIQVVRQMPDGSTTWFIRRITDEEMTAASMMGAGL